MVHLTVNSSNDLLTFSIGYLLSLQYKFSRMEIKLSRYTNKNKRQMQYERNIVTSLQLS